MSFWCLFFCKRKKSELSNIPNRLAGVLCVKYFSNILRLFSMAIFILFGFAKPAFSNISSKGYVDRILLSSGFEDTSNKTTVINSASTDVQYPTARAVYSHTSNVNNPHNVTKTQIGLSNVQNLDQTNASNLLSGVVPFPRLPTGTVANTVATGDDSRFFAIPTSQPGGTAPTGWSWIWIEP